MSGLNFASSVSPAFNALKIAGSGQGLAQGLLGNMGSPGSGPLSGAATPAAQAMQSQATQYRPPTQVYERGVFGNQFRDVTPQEHSGYNQQWLGDQRNQGGGQGQVDRGLAQAAMAKEGENAGGGEGGK